MFLRRAPLTLLALGIAVIAISAVTSSLPAAAAPSTKETCQAAGGQWTTATLPGGGSEGSCSGYVPALGMTLDEQVRSFVYYRTLGTCLVDGGPNLKDGAWFEGGERLSRAHAKSGEWFAQAQAPGGLYLDGVSGVTARADTTGAVKCDQTGLVTGALALWDGWAADEALCAMGMRSASDSEYDAKRCTAAQGASDEFKRGDSMRETFQKAVSTRVYGGAEPTITANAKWTDAGKYLLYLKSFTQICAPTAAITTTKPSGTTEKDYVLRIPARTDSGVSFTPTYYLSQNNKTPDQRVVLVAGPSLDRSGSDAESGTCASLVGAINGEDGKNNGLADAYANYLTVNVAAEDSQPGKDCSLDSSCPETQPTCGNTINGIGWMLCPLLSGVATLNDGLWTFTEGLLTVSPLTRTEENGSVSLAFQAWQIFQALANVALIIVFLIMIFSQLTSTGISNYGVKKLLPRLIVAALMINLSFYVMQILVDLANIAGTGIYDLINGPIEEATLPSWESFVATLSTLGVAGGIAAGAIAISPMAALMLALPLALGALLGFLAAVITLMLRQAAIPLLAVLAPLAFVAYLLPNTKSWFDKWRGLFTSMLLLFPLAAILFAGMKMAGYIINSGQQWWMTLTALVVMGAPLFMLPFLARQAAPFLGKIQSGIRSRFSAVEKPVKGWADSRRKLAMAQSDGTKPSWWNLGKRARRGIIRSRRKREIRTAGWVEEANAAFNADIGENAGTLSRGLPTDGAGAAHIRAVTARAQAEEVKLAMDSMKLEASFNPNDRAALARTLADALARGDKTRAVAATNYLVAARGVDELHTTLRTAQAAGQLSEQMTSVMQRTVTSSENGGVVKERRPDITAWGAKGGSIADVTAAPSTWAISAEDAASLSIGAMRAAQAFGGLSSTTAQRVLDTPQLRGKLDPDKEAVMSAIAGRGTSRTVGAIGAETTSSSPDDELHVPRT